MILIGVLGGAAQISLSDMVEAATSQGMTKADKDMRYKWNALITDIAMLNRVPGFGLGLISQQISVINSGLNSSIQEEAGLKLHFGET